MIVAPQPIIDRSGLDFEFSGKPIDGEGVDIPSDEDAVRMHVLTSAEVEVSMLRCARSALQAGERRRDRPGFCHLRFQAHLCDARGGGKDRSSDTRENSRPQLTEDRGTLRSSD